jgi:3-deoxy-D-manno-octulosonate 8-phosphate phosphatase (KDO 8-P phosphatase)
MTYLAELDAYIDPVKESLKRVRLVIFDVDGVLTDGHLNYNDIGESLKRFHVRDGVGLKLLADMGVHVAIVTAKDSLMVKNRMNELGIQHYFPGVKDKLELTLKLASSLNVGLEECAFVGDDMVDLPPMQAVGISFCPSDAYPLISEMADIVLAVPGGKGVARLVCDILLQSKGQFEAAYQLASSSAFERNRHK